MFSDHGDEKHETKSDENTSANRESSKSNHNKVDDTDKELTDESNADVLHNGEKDVEDHKCNTNTELESELRRRERSSVGNPPLGIRYDDYACTVVVSR